MSPSEYAPTSLPGSRAPHVKLIKNGNAISSLDLFEKNFVLLIGATGEAWRTAANDLSPTLTIPLAVYKIATDGDLIDPDNIWCDTYDISSSGAVLVRPDGHVAWRSRLIVDNPKAELEKCLGNFQIKTYSL